uniref:Uncharacterized protein n=1 Tax=Noccaea caerulescens TaxID=107243 RepID=A0A1J3GMX4_NOCCA
MWRLSHYDPNPLGGALRLWRRQLWTIRHWWKGRLSYSKKSSSQFPSGPLGLFRIRAKGSNKGGADSFRRQALAHSY